MIRPAPLALLACVVLPDLARAQSSGPSQATAAQPDTERLSRENEELRKRLDRLEAEVHGSVPQAQAAVQPEPPLLAPTILVETDYRVYPSEVEGITGFSISRFRPGLVLAPAPWFRAVATAEFAGEYATILDAFLRVRPTDAVEFTAGYSKPPLFPSYVYEPDHSLPFPDRAPVVTSFRIRRDVGADAHFTPRKLPLEAWLRVGNGSGSPLGNDTALPAGYAALDLVLGRAWAGAAKDQRWLGLRLGLAGLVESVRDRDGIVGQTPLGFVYFRPIVVSGLRSVSEGHLIGYAGPLRLTVEGAVAYESRSRDDDGDPETPRLPLPGVESYGLTSEFAWVALGTSRQVGHAPKARERSQGGWSGGALEVGVRYDGMWLGLGADDVDRGGSQGVAASLKWWPVDFVAATVFGYFARYYVPPIEEPDQDSSWGFLARLSFFWGLPGGALSP